MKGRVQVNQTVTWHHAFGSVDRGGHGVESIGKASTYVAVQQRCT
ncbi:hypothetical protein [Runella rosea]